MPRLHMNRSGHFSGWHHHRPHCHSFTTRVGPQLHISRHTGLPTPYLHVHKRPWYDRCCFWRSPTYAAPIATTSIGHSHAISPVSAIIAAYGVTALISGVAMAILGACFLPVTFGGSMALIASGSVVATGGAVLIAAAAAA